MKRTLIVAAMSVGLALGFGGVAIADDDDDDKKSDFALFDGTNPLSVTGGKTGVLCGVSNRTKTALVPKSFTYHFAVTNFDSVERECRVIYSTDFDFVRYKIPVGSSFSFSQAAGSGEFDAGVRLSCDAQVAGAGSAQGPTRVFCLSCGTAADDVICDAIIPN